MVVVVGARGAEVEGKSWKGGGGDRQRGETERKADNIPRDYVPTVISQS